MKHHLRTLTGALALAAIGTGSALAQTTPYDFSYTNGPYVGIEGGWQFLNHISPSGGGAGVNSHYKNDYLGLGVVGYGFGNGFRAELEGGHRYNGLGYVTGDGGNRGGSLGMTTVMVNGLYDINPALIGLPYYGVTPHLGLGLGWARARFNDAGPYNGNIISGHDDLLAFQGIAGVDYAVTSNIKVNLDYRLLGTTRGTFAVSNGATTKSSFTDQAVLLGVRYEFNAPPPPPPPPPAPAPMPTPAVAPAPAPEPQRSFQVFFDFNKANVSDTAAQTVQQAADLARQGHPIAIKVTGHADTVGTAAYNQKLSERRADAVKAALVADGVPDTEIQTLGVGKTDLLVPTPDGVREPQNRRATIEFGNNP